MHNIFKKFITFCTLIFVLLSNFQTGVLYAQNLSSLEKEKKQALETITDSLEDWKSYSLIISTKYDRNKTLSIFKKFDSKIKLDFLYYPKFF